MNSIEELLEVLRTITESITLKIHEEIQDIQLEARSDWLEHILADYQECTAAIDKATDDAEETYIDSESEADDEA